jgi:hypothetical protein
LSKKREREREKEEGKERKKSKILLWSQTVLASEVSSVTY